MYFEFICTKCQKNLKIRDENVGRRVRCPHCHHSQIVHKSEGPKSKAGDQNRSSGSSSRSRSEKDQRASEPRSRSTSQGSGTSFTEVSLYLSAGIGVAIFVAFYAVLFPFRHTYLGALFYDRGWVPIALVYLMGWSIAVLTLKSRKLGRQRESMYFDLLPNEIGEVITVQTVGRFEKHIRSLPVNPTQSFLVNRVLRGLEHFRILKNNSEVADRLESQSHIDTNAVASSYTLLKVFIWAIPILGFIGTVIGISTAVGGFSGSLSDAKDITTLKESLNSVTGGLATAFDTTLIALIMSMLVMFPTSSLQKAEEDLLNWVDEYCNENLLKRLKDGSRESSIALSSGPNTLDTIVAKLGDRQASFVESLESVGRSIADGQRMLSERLDLVVGNGETQSNHGELKGLLSGLQQSIDHLNDTTRKSSETTLEVFGHLRRSYADGQNGVRKPASQPTSEAGH